MICPKCHKEYSSKMNYCICCGVELIEKQDDEGCGISFSPPEKSAEVTPAPEFAPTDKAVIIEKEQPPELEEIPLKQKQHAKISVRTVAKATVSGILSAMLFGTVCLFSGTVAGRIFTDRGTVIKAVDSIDILSLPATEIGIAHTDKYTVSDNATVSEAIAVMAAGSGITGSNIRSIYEVSAIHSLLAQTAEDYSVYLRTGQKPQKLTSEAVKKAVKDTAPLVSEATGIEFSETDLEIAYSSIDAFGGIIESISVNSIEKSTFGRNLRLIRAYISIPALVAETAAAAVIIALLYLLNRNLSKTLRCIGLSLFPVGLIVILANFLFSMQLGFANSGSIIVNEALRGLSAVTSDSLYALGGIIFFIGGTAIIWSAALKAERKKRT